MSLIFLSDIHATSSNPIGRTDNVLETIIKKLKYVLDFARKNESRIYQAGDFFHTPRDWKALYSVVEILFGHVGRICAVFGQHDTYFYSEKTRGFTSLGILMASKLIQPLGEVPKIHKFKKNLICVYGTSFGQKIPTPQKQDEKHINILVIHAPITVKPLFEGHQIIKARKYLKQMTDFDMIFCGDIHRHFYLHQKERVIANAGPMLRLEATEYNFNHTPGFFFLDENSDGKMSLKFKNIPHEPADKVLTTSHIEVVKESKGVLDRFIADMKIDIDSGVDIIKNIHEFMDKNEISKEIRDIIAEVISDDRSKRED